MIKYKITCSDCGFIWFWVERGGKAIADQVAPVTCPRCRSIRWSMIEEENNAVDKKPGKKGPVSELQEDD